MAMYQHRLAAVSCVTLVVTAALLLQLGAAFAAATDGASSGSADGIAAHPRFRYTIVPGDTLSEIALRFGSDVSWIASLNPDLTSIHRIRAGDSLIIPVQFPLPGNLQVDRLQALDGSFLGTYTLAEPFSQVRQVLERFAGALREAGFDVEVAQDPAQEITLRGRGVVLGRILFSAAQASGATRVHVALLFTPRREFDEQDLEMQLQPESWPTPAAH